MPKGANIVQPVDRAEAEAVGLFLGWVADLVDVAVENEGRAELARKGVC